jgi:hypothetical protein
VAKRMLSSQEGHCSMQVGTLLRSERVEHEPKDIIRIGAKAVNILSRIQLSLTRSLWKRI